MIPEWEHPLSPYLDRLYLCWCNPSLSPPLFPSYLACYGNVGERGSAIGAAAEYFVRKQLAQLCVSRIFLLTTEREIYNITTKLHCLVNKQEIL